MAVCLVGQLRWFSLTLANLRHLLLGFMQHHWRGYYVGPADGHFRAAQPLLVQHFAGAADTCAYEPNVTWSWAGRRAPFELHKHPPCAPASHEFANRRSIHLNVDRLPPFANCRSGRYGKDEREKFFPLPVDTDSERREGKLGPPCTSAISMVMQLWQAARCADLVEAAEAREPALWHSRVLRLRSDLYFFHPVALPPLPDVATRPSYSMMESSCEGMALATHRALYGGGNKGRLRFVPDLWMYGSRVAMLPGLRAPLATLVDENETLRQDPRQRYLIDRAGPGVWNHSYYIHPWPHAMHTLFGTSACVNWAGLIGLTRINPSRRCIAVQARTHFAVRKANVSRHNARAHNNARNWQALDATAQPYTWASDWELHIMAAAPSMDAHRVAALPAILRGIYRTCFGLGGNVSCERVVGDRQLGTDRRQSFNTSACGGFAVADTPLQKGRIRPPPDPDAWHVHVAGCEADELNGARGDGAASAHECASAALASFVGGRHDTGHNLRGAARF